MVTKDMLRRAPKVELHDHLDGGLRPSTIIDLAGEYGLDLPASEPEELASWLHRGASRKNLGLYLEGFSLTTAVMRTKDAIERVAREAIEDLAADGVVYAEIRFAPILHVRDDLDLESIVEAALRGMEAGKRTTGTEYGLILCAMRNMSPALSLETAELAVSYRDRGVVGFDLAGDESGHPPKRHLEAFQYIRGKNFNITIHAGEAFGPESIWQALQVCGAHRIGHGTRLVEDMASTGTRIDKMGSLASYVRDRRIPLECCLSSNVQTGAAADYSSHPFNVYYRNDFRVSLCTDNRLMSSTSLSDEFALAVEHFGLTLRDVERLSVNAMKSAFIPYGERVRIIFDVIKPRYARLRDETNPHD
ncbi:MAG: adenosine deaminase [Spirochaetales bacterium]|nr:adenosine deaminase [Spirochaetales bacterium]